MFKNLILRETLIYYNSKSDLLQSVIFYLISATIFIFISDTNISANKTVFAGVIFILLLLLAQGKRIYKAVYFGGG